jgi:D-cysteine desulfhydrase
MAKQLAGLRADIVSVPIAWEGARVRSYVVDVIERARRRYGLPVDPPREVRLLDGFQGAGRAEIRREDFEMVLRLARLEGLIFDPVYTGKAFAGVLHTLQRDPKAFGRRVCFVHTGGVFSVFPYRSALSRLSDGDTLVNS